MKARASSFWEWQTHFSGDKACIKEIIQTRWPDDFQCEKCGHNHGWLLHSRSINECAQCHHQTSVTGTLFHSTKLTDVATLNRTHNLKSLSSVNIGFFSFPRDVI